MELHPAPGMRSLIAWLPAVACRMRWSLGGCATNTILLHQILSPFINSSNNIALVMPSLVDHENRIAYFIIRHKLLETIDPALADEVAVHIPLRQACMRQHHRH